MRTRDADGVIVGGAGPRPPAHVDADDAVVHLGFMRHRRCVRPLHGSRERVHLALGPVSDGASWRPPSGGAGHGV